MVDGCGLVLELVRRLDHHVGRAGDEIMRLQQPIDRRLRDKILLVIVGNSIRLASEVESGDALG
jgi:hypothetical protein